MGAWFILMMFARILRRQGFYRRKGEDDEIYDGDTFEWLIHTMEAPRVRESVLLYRSLRRDYDRYRRRLLRTRCVRNGVFKICDVIYEYGSGSELAFLARDAAR